MRVFDYSNRRVLVTGGARGIGAATACALRAQGARVAIGARDPSSIDAFVSAHGSEGIVAAVGDIRDQRGARAVVDAAIDRLGGLDVLINSAGVFAEVPVEAISEAHWNETLAINLSGTFFCSQAALAALADAGGNIVNVASDAGIVGYPNGVAYSAAKGGVVNLTRAMAVELAPRLRVNCVCPGNVDTDMIRRAAAASADPDGYLERARSRARTRRMASAEEIAAAILYLASREAASTTGAVLVVDGGGAAGY